MAMSLPDDARTADQIFMDWIGQQFRDLKERGVSRTKAAETGQVSRNQTYEWEGRGQKGFSKPRPETIKTFCIKNGLDWRIPYRIYGWDTAGRSHADIPEESDLVRRVRLIDIRLSQNPPAEERRRLERAKVAIRHLLDMTEVDEERRQA